MLSLFRFGRRNTAKVAPADDPYLRLRFLQNLPNSLWVECVQYGRTLSYHRTQFNRAMSLLESLAYQEIDAAKIGVLAEFLTCCQTTPALLVMDAPTTELTFPMTLVENFLEQKYLFTSAGEHAFYVHTFEELLTAMPVSLAGASTFDYQDEFGFNLLMHVVKYRDSGLLEAYLEHPQVRANMNYDFVDRHTHFNVFCLVYAFKQQEAETRTTPEFANENVGACLAILHHYGVRFSVDHLCAVLRAVEPLFYRGDSHYNLKQAIYDFCTLNINKKHKLTDKQYETLQTTLATHAFMSRDPIFVNQSGARINLQILVQNVAPLPVEDNADKVVLVVTEPVGSTSVFYKAGGTVGTPAALASSSSFEGEPDRVPEAGVETK